jgi:hypothetical protein
MECYEGATMIKTYRGNLAHLGQDKLNLRTNRGDIGYKINKFQIINNQPTTTSAECVVKIYKLEQSTIDYKIDFSDGDLLGVAVFSTNATAEANPEDLTIIFDNEVFNQNIYISLYNSTGSDDCNYYLELEQVTLNENESTMATLQSLRRLGLPRN